MLPKYLTKPDDTPQVKGRKYEKIATQTINSGALFFSKGDINVKDSEGEYLVDTKLTQKKSYSITIKTLTKLFEEASPRTPVLLIKIGGFRVKCIVEKE